MTTLLAIVGALFLIVVIIFFCCEFPLLGIALVFLGPAFLIGSLFGGAAAGFEAVIGGFLGLVLWFGLQD